MRVERRKREKGEWCGHSALRTECGCTTGASDQPIPQSSDVETETELQTTGLFLETPAKAGLQSKPEARRSVQVSQYLRITLVFSEDLH